MMGVIRPPSVATATDTSTVEACCTAPSAQTLFTSGTCRKVAAAAFITKSLTDNLIPSKKYHCLLIDKPAQYSTLTTIFFLSYFIE